MFTVKTNNSTRKTTDHEFYVLCKGNNSGRPSMTANRNSFVVISNSKSESEHLFWITYALWRNKAFKTCLKGSVIPFLTLKDYKMTVMPIAVKSSGENVKKVIGTVQKLDAHEQKVVQTMVIIGQLRNLLLKQLL